MWLGSLYHFLEAGRPTRMSSKGVLRKSVQLRMGVPRLCVCVCGTRVS